MAIVDELTKLVDQRFDERIKELSFQMEVLKPWVKMEMASSILEKESRWIREKFCTYEFKEMGLVKKVGGEWHFQNPEFFKYVHDVWWSEQE